VCWQDQIRQAFERLFEAGPQARIALVGVGHELRGDDAVGLLLVQRLRGRLDSQQVLIVEAGPIPENFSGVLRRFAPSLVLVIDAAHMGAAPGTVRWLDWRDVSKTGLSTHTSSLRLLADYLEQELDCQLTLLGIQPADLSFDAPLSPEVRDACEQARALLLETLPQAPSGMHVGQRLLSEIEHPDGAWVRKN